MYNLSKQLLLELKNVFCGYNKKVVLENVNLKIYPDEFIGIIGQNGSGKTTLVKTILGIIKPLSGKIVKYKKIKFGYVPQLFSIDEMFPLTVYEILTMGTKLKYNEKEILGLLSSIGINFDTLYRDLSGGQKQKVLITRALINQPDILILDEPLNDLDVCNTKSVLEFLINLKQQKKFAIILVSHTLNIVLNFTEKLFLVNNKKIAKVEVLSDLEKLNNTINKTFNTDIKVINYEGQKIIKL